MPGSIVSRQPFRRLVVTAASGGMAAAWGVFGPPEARLQRLPRSPGPFWVARGGRSRSGSSPATIAEEALVAVEVVEADDEASPDLEAAGVVHESACDAW